MLDLFNIISSVFGITGADRNQLNKRRAQQPSLEGFICECDPWLSQPECPASPITGRKEIH